MIFENTRLVRKNDIETAEMGDEIGMLNVETGKYYILNGIGSDIWDVLETEMTFAELVDRLLTIYDVDRKLCEQDTMTFLKELVDNALIQIVQ